MSVFRPEMSARLNIFTQTCVCPKVGVRTAGQTLRTSEQLFQAQMSGRPKCSNSSMFTKIVAKFYLIFFGQKIKKKKIQKNWFGYQTV